MHSQSVEPELLMNYHGVTIYPAYKDEHSAFEDTILYLLKTGPKDTKTLYEEVQGIHPDLCDDSIKLVIKGEQWNQTKWHHRVRHAQQSLKKRGHIRREGSKWRLVE